MQTTDERPHRMQVKYDIFLDGYNICKMYGGRETLLVSIAYLCPRKLNSFQLESNSSAPSKLSLPEARL